MPWQQVGVICMWHDPNTYVAAQGGTYMINHNKLRNKGLLLQKLQTGSNWALFPAFGWGWFHYQKASRVSFLHRTSRMTHSMWTKDGRTRPTKKLIRARSSNGASSYNLQLGGCQKTLGFTVDQSIIYAFLWRESTGQLYKPFTDSTASELQCLVAGPNLITK